MSLINSVQNLEYSLNLMDVILPFILIFTVVYAISAKVLHFGGRGKLGKNLSMVLSVVVTSLTVIPHVTGTYQQFDVVSIINNSVPQVMMLIVGVILALMLIGATGFTGFDAGKNFHKWVTGISIFLLGIILWSNVPGYGNVYSLQDVPILGWLWDSDVQSILLILVIFGGIVYYVTKEDDGKSKSSTAKIAEAAVQDAMDKEKH